MKLQMKLRSIATITLALGLACAAPAWAGPCYRSPTERQRADETAAYESPDQAAGDPVRNDEMYRFCDTEAVIASDAAIAHAAGESEEAAAKEMADNGLPAYVRCRSVQVLADTYFAHPEATPHAAYERERRACMNARGFIFGLR